LLDLLAVPVVASRSPYYDGTQERDEIPLFQPPRFPRLLAGVENACVRYAVVMIDYLLMPSFPTHLSGARLSDQGARCTNKFLWLSAIF